MTRMTIEEPIFVPAKTKREAMSGYADIAVAKKVDGGYRLFPFTHQYDEWVAQCGYKPHKPKPKKAMTFATARAASGLTPTVTGTPQGRKL